MKIHKFSHWNRIQTPISTISDKVSGSQKSNTETQMWPLTSNYKSNHIVSRKVQMYTPLNYIFLQSWCCSNFALYIWLHKARLCRLPWLTKMQDMPGWSLKFKGIITSASSTQTLWAASKLLCKSSIFSRYVTVPCSTFRVFVTTWFS